MALIVLFQQEKGEYFTTKQPIYTADTSFFPLHPPFTFGKRGCF